MASAANDDLGLTTSTSQTGSASPSIRGSQAHNDLYQSGIVHNMTHILSESRPVRVVLYSATPPESEHRFWIDPEVTFGSVAQALAEMYSSQELVVLQAKWGPRPYWAEAHPNSPIGSTCQVLYAILTDQAKPYTMGVVRTSLSDYPIPIYTPQPECSTTLLEAVIASYPKLTGQIKSIVPYFNDHDIQDIPPNEEFIASHLSPATPVFINTLDEPPKEFMVGSLYESFSPSSPKASTSSDSDGLIPPLLQISYMECKLLVQRAYELDAFPLQMIHLSRALLHVTGSLARGLTPAFGENISIIGAALNADDDLAGLLRVAPPLLRQLEGLLDAANAIMDNLASDSFNREGAQHAIENMFFTLCGDLPGAVTVRNSEKVFKKLGNIDCEELDPLALEGMKRTYPEISTGDITVASLDLVIDPDQGSDFRDPLAAAGAGFGLERTIPPTRNPPTRAKGRCWTCRLRRKKCDENRRSDGTCDTCKRLRLQCLGWGVKRPEWFRDKGKVEQYKLDIKQQLSFHGNLRRNPTTGEGPSTSGGALAVTPNPSSNNNISPNGSSTSQTKSSAMYPDTFGFAPVFNSDGLSSHDDRFSTNFHLGGNPGDLATGHLVPSQSGDTDLLGAPLSMYSIPVQHQQHHHTGHWSNQNTPELNSVGQDSPIVNPITSEGGGRGRWRWDISSEADRGGGE